MYKLAMDFVLYSAINVYMHREILMIGKKKCVLEEAITSVTFLLKTGHMVNAIVQTDEEVVRAAVEVDSVDEMEAEEVAVDSAGAGIKTTILEATILRTDNPESVCVSRDGI